MVYLPPRSFPDVIDASRDSRTSLASHVSWVRFGLPTFCFVFTDGVVGSRRNFRHTMCGGVCFSLRCSYAPRFSASGASAFRFHHMLPIGVTSCAKGNRRLSVQLPPSRRGLVLVEFCRLGRVPIFPCRIFIRAILFVHEHKMAFEAWAIRPLEGLKYVYPCFYGRPAYLDSTLNIRPGTFQTSGCPPFRFALNHTSCAHPTGDVVYLLD